MTDIDIYEYYERSAGFFGNNTCSVFGCGNILSLTEALAGNKCIDHQSKHKSVAMESKKQRKIETESLTKGVYHLKYAQTYIDDFRRSSKMEGKHQAATWLAKVNWTVSDIYSSMTQESRDRFHDEFTKGDLLFIESISQAWVQMNPKQRERLEEMANHILSAEEIVIEKITTNDHQEK